MDVPEQPGAMFALLAVFVVVGFLFLLGLAKGRLSERQQTLVWVILTVFFFSVCSGFVRSNMEAAPSTVYAKQAEVTK